MALAWTAWRGVGDTRALGCDAMEMSLLSRTDAFKFQNEMRYGDIHACITSNCGQIRVLKPSTPLRATDRSPSPPYDSRAAPGPGQAGQGSTEYSLLCKAAQSTEKLTGRLGWGECERRVGDLTASLNKP